MDYSEIIKKIKSSIALILVFDSSSKIIGTGSGFIFKKKGILVTCNHVIKDGVTFLLKFSGKENFVTAKVVLRDEEHDLALMKFEDQADEPLILGAVEKVTEGMPVFFSGYPFISQDMTTHQGIISAIVKDATGITSYLIDGTVNSGNSGCPLMDKYGNVIGVVDAKNRARGDILDKVEKMSIGAIALHNVDMVEIYQALINNVQIGSGHAVPASYIPDYKEILTITTKDVMETPKDKKKGEK
jgi:serine protease Do